jgi:hypothetical protein
MPVKLTLLGTLLCLTLLAPGCVCKALKSQAETMAAVNDGYTRKSVEALAELLASGELAITPPSVRVFVQRLLNTLAKNRRGWHEANDAVNDAGLPPDLDGVVTLPALPSGE